MGAPVVFPFQTAAQECYRVALDLLAAAAAVGLAPPRQRVLYHARVDVHARRHALDDGEEGFAVGVTGGEKANGHQCIPGPMGGSARENSSTASTISFTSKPWSVQMRKLSAACATSMAMPPSVLAPARRAVSRNGVWRGW